jgi:hypothetical protein
MRERINVCTFTRLRREGLKEVISNKRIGSEGDENKPLTALSMVPQESVMRTTYQQ